jgi:hypothetical protein
MISFCLCPAAFLPSSSPDPLLFPPSLSPAPLLLCSSCSSPAPGLLTPVDRYTHLARRQKQKRTRIDAKCIRTCVLPTHTHMCIRTCVLPPQTQTLTCVLPTHTQTGIPFFLGGFMMFIACWACCCCKSHFIQGGRESELPKDGVCIFQCVCACCERGREGGRQKKGKAARGGGRERGRQRAREREKQANKRGERESRTDRWDKGREERGPPPV